MPSYHSSQAAGTGTGLSQKAWVSVLALPTHGMISDWPLLASQCCWEYHRDINGESLSEDHYTSRLCLSLSIASGKWLHFSESPSLHLVPGRKLPQDNRCYLPEVLLS